MCLIDSWAGSGYGATISRLTCTQQQGDSEELGYNDDASMGTVVLLICTYMHSAGQYWAEGFLRLVSLWSKLSGLQRIFGANNDTFRRLETCDPNLPCSILCTCYQNVHCHQHLTKIWPKLAATCLITCICIVRCQPEKLQLIAAFLDAISTIWWSLPFLCVTKTVIIEAEKRTAVQTRLCDPCQWAIRVLVVHCTALGHTLSVLCTQNSRCKFGGMQSETRLSLYITRTLQEKPNRGNEGSLFHYFNCRSCKQSI